MPIVSSFGTLQHFDRGAPPFVQTASVPASSVSETQPWIAQQAFAIYAAMYATQPNIRICVDFLARNIAQLGMHLFRRMSDTDRQRLHSDAADLIEFPNPATTRYRLFESLMSDLAIYFNAFLLKVRRPDGTLRGLVRLPPESVTIDGWLQPLQFLWTAPNGDSVSLAPIDVVYFNGYNPLNPLFGLSPIETLRRQLAEGAAATGYRAAYWRNAARIEGVIERPLSAPKWNSEQRLAFREQWQARYAHSGPGLTAVLEDGMTWKATAFSMKDSEYVDALKLSREICAAAYQIPAPMVGILDHATFSNITEQHKQTYQDCLGPWTVNLALEFNRQVLPEFASSQAGDYYEFNIAEKLKGSFEEQAAALRNLVGRPIMTANEGRARLNLPSITDDPSANELALPLNVGSGAGSSVPTPPAASAVDPVIAATRSRQRARLVKLDPAERPVAFEQTFMRWASELATDLQPLYEAAGWAPVDAARESLAESVRLNRAFYDTLTREAYEELAHV